MPLPSDAPVIARVIDPSDEYDFVVGFPELDTANGEAIGTLSVTLSSEAVALGITLGTATRAPSIVNDPKTGAALAAAKFWLTVDPSKQSDPAFTEGVTLGVSFTIVTTSNPSRTAQRAVGIQFKQRG